MPPIKKSTPKQDGFWMPGEFEPQKQVWMLWPLRTDVWRDGAKPAQEAYARVAEAICQFEPVTMGVSKEQYTNARAMLPKGVRVVEMSSNDAWMRDMAPAFVINGSGTVRGVDWGFNAWGGLTDGLYFPWDQDAMIAEKICSLEGMRRYDTTDFICENGSIHTDGEGTLLTTEMCLLSAGRNPQLSKRQIEEKLSEYLNIEKVIWLKDGMDPAETNGHIDDVACFVKPGEVACIWTEDPEDPFYGVSRSAYEQLSQAVDAKGRRLKVHKICMPKKPVYIEKGFRVDNCGKSLPRLSGDLCTASYVNFLTVNGGIIVPQYGDENDELALSQIAELFPGRKAVGVYTREIVYGGGNIHCVTMQQPLGGGEGYETI